MGSQIVKLVQGMDTPISVSEKGQPNGVATLDETGKVPDSQIPDGITRDTELAAHVGAGGTAHALATTSSAGFMSAADKAKLNGIPSGGVPTGVVMPFAGSVPPSGWLECNGAAVSRTTYAALFSIIGTTYGAGDGTTTFNLPDLRGEFIRGWDHGRGVDSGRTLGSWQADGYKSHSHNPSITGALFLLNTYPSSGNMSSNPSGAGYWTTSSATASAGGTETRPRNVALMFIIKT